MLGGLTASFAAATGPPSSPSLTGHFTGTSLLILVGVSLEFVRRVHAETVTHRPGAVGNFFDEEDLS